MTNAVPPDWSTKDSFWEGLYDLMFDPDRIARADGEVDQIEALVKVPERGRVLDLCCGPGRHSVELARRGYQVVGVDRTERYLAVARERAAAAGVDAEFVAADARDYRGAAPVDLALNLWTSFGYFAEPEDNLRVLRTAHAALREGGTFVLQTRSKETIPRHLPVERTWWERDGVLFLEEQKVVDDWRRAYGRWVVVHPERGRQDYTYLAWLYSGPALASMLTDAGFRSVALYGDLGGSPYDLHAKCLVAVAVK